VKSAQMSTCPMLGECITRTPRGKSF